MYNLLSTKNSSDLSGHEQGLHQKYWPCILCLVESVFCQFTFSWWGCGFAMTA